MPNPGPIRSTPPAPPTKLAYTASITMTRKQKKELMRMLHPLTRPAQISPKRRVKWRLQQKWWNRYEKPRLIGSEIIAETKNGIRFRMRVTDARRSKDGHRGFLLDVDAKPIHDHGAEGMP